MSAFRFLALPAELRNRVYEFLADDGRIVRRLVLQTPGDGGISLVPQGLLAIAIAQVCKQLRNEYLPLWMKQAQVCIIAKDLSRFLRTFCRTTTHADGSTLTLCPRAITILIPDHDREKNAIRNSSVDLLPLLELHSEAPGLTIIFETEHISSPVIDPLRRRHTRSRRQRPVTITRFPITVYLQDISQLMICDDETWLTLMRSKQLSQVLLHPYATGSRTHIELVFHGRSMEIRFSEVNTRCYLPELRRLGLEGVYRNTSSLSVGARLTAEAADAENESWDETMLGGFDLEASSAAASTIEPHVEESDDELMDEFLLAWDGSMMARS